MAFIPPSFSSSCLQISRSPCLLDSARKSSFVQYTSPRPCQRTQQPIPSPSQLYMVAATRFKSSENSPSSSSVSALYDVIVIGGGPAGLSLAAGLGRRGVNTLCADLSLDKPWPNNYGTWIDELKPLGLADCTSHKWEHTSAYVRADGKKSKLGRPYARVDRTAMKKRFLDRCSESGKVQVVKGIVRDVDVVGSNEFTEVTLDIDGDERVVRGGVVVDCTGHLLRFVEFHEGKTPGFQAAYGIECTVKGSVDPWDSDEMLLMDFRDDHMQGNSAEKRQSTEKPTFVYVMPMDGAKGQRWFFEETSLVASPAMDFEELKQRLYKRLNYYGVEVSEVLDEEFCLIPMGGEMPKLRQRVVAFGGAAALVHPATGYMIARALKLADQAAAIIAKELSEGGNADETAHRIWDRLWNEGRRRQRDFFNFGGEYLRKIDLDTTRDFFGAFFELPKDEWSGFLSFRLMKPLERLSFGLGVFARTTNRVRTSIVKDAIVNGRVPLLMSILPIYPVEEEM